MRWLVRLYPKSWRRQYEAEFLAFLEQERPFSLAQRLDIARSIVDAHIYGRRTVKADGQGTRDGRLRRVAMAGTGTILTAMSDGEGVIMRRQSLAVLFLLLGLGLGLFLPYAGQTVRAKLTNGPSQYTAHIYRDMVPAGGRSSSISNTDILNSGRDMPHLVVVVTPPQSTPPLEFSGERDHHPVILHFLHLGHGTTAYDLGPLKHGQTGTVRMLFTSNGHDVTWAQPEFYARIPYLNRPDPAAKIVQLRG
jgi:hypothetical protein